MTGAGARLRRVGLFVVAFLALVVMWEAYKAIGPAGGGKLFGWRVLPRTEDSAMPHVWDVLRRFDRPELRGGHRTILSVVVAASWFTMRIALTGFALGVVVGLALAMLMARWRVAERGLLPYVILSQTVPLIALSPLVVSWGGKLKLGGFEWEKWMSAAVISAFLAFFPVAVGGLRGLKSASKDSLELMASYAASGRQTLVKLRFPAAVPYLVPALKLAAAAAVVGTVVAEISAGVKGGVGRLIIEYSREATSDPAKKFTAVLGAVVVGLALAGLVAVIELVLMRHRPKEQVS
jgi:NitT/TauT family transport system permease protein